MESFFADLTLAISASYSKLRHDQEYLARMCYTRYKPYSWEDFYQRVRIETDRALEYFHERGHSDESTARQGTDDIVRSSVVAL